MNTVIFTAYHLAKKKIPPTQILHAWFKVKILIESKLLLCTGRMLKNNRIFIFS